MLHPRIFWVISQNKCGHSLLHESTPVESIFNKHHQSELARDQGITMLSRLCDSTGGLRVEEYVLFPFLETHTTTSQTTDFAHFHSRDVRKALDDHEIILNSSQPFNFPYKESSD